MKSNDTFLLISIRIFDHQHGVVIRGYVNRNRDTVDITEDALVLKTPQSIGSTEQDRLRKRGLGDP